MNKYCRLMFCCTHCGMMRIKWFADKAAAQQAVDEGGPTSVLMTKKQFKKFVNDNPHLNYIGEFHGESTKVIYNKGTGRPVPCYSTKDVAIQERREQ